MFAIGPRKPERIFYIIYFKDARMVKQNAGRQFQDYMPAPGQRQSEPEDAESEVIPKRQWAVSRMEKAIAMLSGHYMVCGMSHSARVIMDELEKTGRNFVVDGRPRNRSRPLIFRDFPLRS